MRRDALGRGRGITPGEVAKTGKNLKETNKNSNLCKIGSTGDQVRVSIKDQRRKGNACYCI